MGGLQFDHRAEDATFRRRLDSFDEETLYCVQPLAWCATMVASVFSLAGLGFLS
jgi:hypothetical protein